MTNYGPELNISKELHAQKYRGPNETFEECMNRIANHLKDDAEHYQNIRDILLNQRFLPGGRIQAAVGTPRTVTPYNCFVSGTIQDSMNSIMDRAKEAAITMRMGGGIGYDFSTLRPRGAHISTLDAPSSGPVTFMEIFDAVCKTISSAGNRRGAQMGVLRVDHPDIEEFIHAKQNSDKLTQFNISVAITDEFMSCLKTGKPFELKFKGKVYRRVNAANLWDKIMRATWDWAEPGVLFIDTINRKNNLWYAEKIATTNPCGEQPLGPYSACLLGSFNLVKYVADKTFNYDLFRSDIRVAVRMMDNIIDRAVYPLPEQEKEAKSKRRMGLGLTGVANALEYLGFKYASEDFLSELESIMAFMRDEVYAESARLAGEKGAFPLFDLQKYLYDGEFTKTLSPWVKELIEKNGIRNSHLLSIAPTGTISLCADNVSSGIEPPFMHYYERTIRDYEGERIERIEDYAYRVWGVEGKTANETAAMEHVAVLNVASKYVDSAVSKTCNVGDGVTWDEFKQIYIAAYEGGASGCTTFRAAGKRYGILNAPKEEPEIKEGTACFYDPATGKRTCE